MWNNPVFLNNENNYLIEKQCEIVLEKHGLESVMFWVEVLKIYELGKLLNHCV